ncbi:cytochrome P450 [Alicyclobacillus sp. TC]|uniref:cytochrome P450 n=1 Tax=Alicyclobacillus sp. TC TaxID=2606450 RepID=UPI001931352B|nr:cytochrome P450 [Alicyclobacillus sp. TC]QRF22770.1 cytochrome P450 [Alicyclobacillus sp. TC]
MDTKIDLSTPAVGGFLRSASRSKEERLNPFPWYRKQLEKGAVLADDSYGGWHIFGYTEAQTALRNHTHFSSERFRNSGNMTNPRPSILNLDPPRHTQLRSLVNTAFTPKAIRHWSTRIQEIVDELLNSISINNETEETIDLVSTLAYPLPVIVIAEMMGIPAKDREKFKRWSDVLVEGPSSLTPEIIMDLMQRKQVAREEMRHYFYDVLAKSQHPEHSLIAILLEANLEREKLTAEELISFCILLLAAGNETTTNLITNFWRCMLQYPQALEDLQHDHSLVPSAIEETLRYYSPVQATSRIVTEDIEFYGVEMKSGDHVTIWLAAANRDSSIFTNPDTFDIYRSPNHHLAFGHGIHFCLGAPLARLEAEIAIHTMLQRFSSFQAVPAEWEPIISGFVFGLHSYPMKIR